MRGPRQLGLASAITLVVANMIGTGVFTTDVPMALSPWTVAPAEASTFYRLVLP